MALYDYPHTGNYDQDLGFLIKKYKDLIAEYEKLINVYQVLIDNINLVIRRLFEEGKIKLDCIYTEDTRDISFVFSVVENNKTEEEKIIDEVLKNGK